MATDQVQYGMVRKWSGSRFHLDTAPVGEIIIDSSLPAALPSDPSCLLHISGPSSKRVKHAGKLKKRFVAVPTSH